MAIRYRGFERSGSTAKEMDGVPCLERVACQQEASKGWMDRHA